MFKVIIAGGRDFSDYRLLKLKMNKILKDVTDDIQIVSGTAGGADKLGEKYAKEMGYKIKEVPADWDDFTEPCMVKTNQYGKEYNALAGNKRNIKMAEYGDALVAFWNKFSPGTKDMIEQAKKRGLKVRVIYY